MRAHNQARACLRAWTHGQVELNDGLRRLKLDPPICLSDDDWENITEKESLCNAKGELEEEHFMWVIKEQLKAQMLSQLVNSMAVADPIQVSIISVLKLFLSQTDPTVEPPAKRVSVCVCLGLFLKVYMCTTLSLSPSPSRARAQFRSVTVPVLVRVSVPALL
jgi:hypothetical protein